MGEGGVGEKRGICGDGEVVLRVAGHDESAHANGDAARHVETLRPHERHQRRREKQRHLQNAHLRLLAVEPAEEQRGEESDADADEEGGHEEGEEVGNALQHLHAVHHRDLQLHHRAEHQNRNHLREDRLTVQSREDARTAPVRLEEGNHERRVGGGHRRGEGERVPEGKGT